MLQHLRDQVHQLSQGEVPGCVREDLQDSPEVPGLQSHSADVQETPGERVQYPDLSMYLVLHSLVDENLLHFLFQLPIYNGGYAAPGYGAPPAPTAPPTLVCRDLTETVCNTSTLTGPQVR